MKINTDFIIKEKIILAHKLGKNIDQSFNPYYFIDDIKSFLDIDTIILSEGKL